MASRHHPELRIDSEATRQAWVEALKRASGGNSGRSYTSPFAAYAEDPVRFGREMLGGRFWPGQEAIPRALIKHKRVVVRGPRKAGKSHIVAVTALSFMSTAPTIGIITAPGEKQIREILFSKIRTMHARARTQLPGVLGVDSLRIEPDWYMIGVAASDPENVLGFHAGIKPFDDEEAQAEIQSKESVFETIARVSHDERTLRLLLIFDEAVGIDQSIFDALEGSMAGDNVYAMMIANPRMAADSGHYYANAFRKGSGWYRIHIAAEEPKDDPTPSDECYHSVPENLLPKSWIEQRRAILGESHPLWYSDILGCFSDSSLDAQIIPYHILLGATKWDLVDDLRPESRHIGIDVAGGETAGADFCYATCWINGVLSLVHRWKSKDTMESVGIIEALAQHWSPTSDPIPWQNIHIDGTGVGKGACDRLRQRGLFIDAVNFGAKPRYDWKALTGDMKFRDRKAELYWVLRRALQEKLAVVPQKYQDVWRELQWHTQSMIPRGGDNAMKINETKDELRERYNRSPDSADSAVLAWSRTGTRPTFMLV